MTIWPKNESPTGRGYGQGSDSYRADDVIRMEYEDKLRLADKRLKALQDIRDMTTDCQVDRLLEIRLLADEALALGNAVCTCRNSSFGMDIDRCPVHGEGCA